MDESPLSSLGLGKPHNVRRRIEVCSRKENLTRLAQQRVFLMCNAGPGMVFAFNQLMRSPVAAELTAFLLQFNVCMILADPEELKKSAQEGVEEERTWNAEAQHGPLKP